VVAAAPEGRLTLAALLRLSQGPAVFRPLLGRPHIRVALDLPVWHGARVLVFTTSGVCNCILDESIRLFSGLYIILWGYRGGHWSNQFVLLISQKRPRQLIE